mmetsp:Transcript_14783/g.20428  ORF Transcript_14783/g.20428 Transcript_14783/m.20428 type:complete len:220 (-) Transcript_14783:69-728(-)
MTSKKPIWFSPEAGPLRNFLRLQSGEATNLSILSASPCKKNSSCKPLTQATCAVCGSVVWPRSANLMAISMRTCFLSSDNSRPPRTSSGDNFCENWLVTRKCSAISVAKTMLITVTRKLLRSWAERRSMKLVAGRPSSRKHMESEWFSNTCLSLWVTASGSAVLMRKLLFFPWWSKSWMTAAMMQDRNSRSDKMAGYTDPEVRMVVSLCMTSAAWALLW